jgi:hypothetical protein
MVWHAEQTLAQKLLAAAAALGPDPETLAPPIVPDHADADADTVDSAPPVEVAADDHVEPDREPAEDFEPIAAYRLRRGVSRPAIRWLLSQMQSGILVMALISIAVVGWRQTIVRTLPRTASFYALLGMPVNLRGLAFDDIVTTTEQHDGVPVLVVEGNIFNDARKTEGVPRLKFVGRNAARQEIYSWTTTPARNVLPPGEMVSFRTRLASPPPDAHDLVLRFDNRREFITGAR